MLKEDLSKVIAGRSINEILKRFDNKIRDPRGASKGKNVSKIIKEFLKIKCPINKAANELNKFFKILSNHFTKSNDSTNICFTLIVFINQNLPLLKYLV